MAQFAGGASAKGRGQLVLFGGEEGDVQVFGCSAGLLHCCVRGGRMTANLPARTSGWNWLIPENSLFVKGVHALLFLTHSLTTYFRIFLGVST